MRRVAFTLIGGGKGTGGYNYLLNLVRVLCMHESKRVTPVLLVGTDVPDDAIEPFRAARHAEIVRTPAMNESRKSAALGSAIVFGADSALKKLLEELRIDVLFESAQFFGGESECQQLHGSPTFSIDVCRTCLLDLGTGNGKLAFVPKSPHNARSC